MEVVRYQRDKHLEAITIWGTTYVDYPLDMDSILPDLGFVVEDEDGDIVTAAWIYDSKPCLWLEWVIYNPKASKRSRVKALDLLLNHIVKYADSREDINITFSSLELGPYMLGLSNRLESLNFKKLKTHSLYARG
jgi:hypothetical protein